MKFVRLTIDVFAAVPDSVNVEKLHAMGVPETLILGDNGLRIDAQIVSVDTVSAEEVSNG